MSPKDLIPSRKVMCPACRSLLGVPENLGNRFIRCGRCEHKFQPPRRLEVLDAAVAEWLNEEGEEPDAAKSTLMGHIAPELLKEQLEKEAAAPAAPAEPPKAAKPAAPAPAATAKPAPVKPAAPPAPAAAAMPKPVVQPAPAAAPAKPAPQLTPVAAAAAAIAPGQAATQIQMARCDRDGALMTFPAHLLKDLSFRSAMPRRCLQCGTRTHLEAHVIIYAGVLVDSVSLEAEHEAGKLMVPVDEAKNLSVEQLLERLPLVPNVPAPGNIPMPYWLCDMCNDAGAISAQINVNEAGEGECHLLIANLWRAEEFLSALGARRTRCYSDLSKQIAASVENPWDMQSLVVKNRLQQWFKPGEGEHFIAYVPDRDHTRAEDGMSGIIVSTQRLVHHTKLRHRENEVASPMEMQLAMSKTKGSLQIRATTWDAHLTVDGDGILNLRRALAKGKFRATWR